jgi:hypothetical protein
MSTARRASPAALVEYGEYGMYQLVDRGLLDLVGGTGPDIADGPTNYVCPYNLACADPNIGCVGSNVVCP